MLRVRTVHDAADFVGESGLAPDLIQDLWDSGDSRPDWCFVAEADNQRVGRLGLQVSPTTSDPAWLGTLPSHEASVYGLPLPVAPEVGRHLFAHAAAEVGERLPPTLELRLNTAYRDDARGLATIAEGWGFTLFQEKQGFEWKDDGREIDVPGRLEFRSVDETGIETYRSVMARCGAGTLDRNDRYYWDGCGPENWGRQMSEYLDPEDASLWLLGYAGADAVGYVAVVRDEELVATIAHIGVVPEHRGNGYVGDLLAAATEVARRAGLARMLSDVDVLNLPMAAAMRRAGHHDHPDWHVWAYRASWPEAFT
ncbi:MAG TPA: GNAT family N-acetyltransferase [Acidimicrobiia bacterium]|nr:GNAT family N-acetyltransferase [Acidimicrobiia bacterium]